MNHISAKEIRDKSLLADVKTGICFSKLASLAADCFLAILDLTQGRLKELLL